MPADHVRLPDRSTQRAGHHLQGLVAGMVPVGVVDLLEGVDVEQHQGQRVTEAPGGAQMLLDLVLEAPAVVDAGQFVEVRQRTQVDFEALAVRHVAQDRQHVLVPDDLLGVLHPQGSPVLRSQLRLVRPLDSRVRPC